MTTSASRGLGELWTEKTVAEDYPTLQHGGPAVLL